MTQPETTAAPVHLLMRALYGEPMPTSAVGKALWRCRRDRALRSWITPGCYAWWRLTGDLKDRQRDLLAFRRAV